MVDVGNLDLNVDITVSGPEDYIDNAPPALPMGSYDFKLLDFGLREYQGELKRTAAGHPILRVNAQVVGGAMNGRIVRNQDIYFTPFQRKRQDGTTATVSGVGDFCRGLDRTFTFASIGEVLNFLQRCKDEGRTFKARWNYEAYDKTFYEAQKALRGISDDKSPEGKALRREATLSGKKHFPDGKVSAEGPSGEVLEAQGRFGDFYSKK